MDATTLHACQPVTTWRWPSGVQIQWLHMIRACFRLPPHKLRALQCSPIGVQDHGISCAGSLDQAAACLDEGRIQDSCIQPLPDCIGPVCHRKFAPDVASGRQGVCSPGGHLKSFDDCLSMLSNIQAAIPSIAASAAGCLLQQVASSRLDMCEEAAQHALLCAAKCAGWLPTSSMRMSGVCRCRMRVKAARRSPPGSCWVCL